MSNAWQVYLYATAKLEIRIIVSFFFPFNLPMGKFYASYRGGRNERALGERGAGLPRKTKSKRQNVPRYGDEKKRTYLKCRPRRVIPHCLDVCNEFAYVFECGHSRFSAVLLAASQFIYAPGINVSYAVSAAAKNYVCTANV